MKKSKIITILILVAVVIIAVYFYYQGQNRKPTNQINITNQNQTENTEVEKIPEILGNKADLISCSVKPGSTISGNLVFNGIVKNAYFFEGNIVINILDQNKTVLKTSHGNAVTDWMTSGPVSFTGSIDLAGLPAGVAYFEIHNDNPGWPDEGFDKSILIPVVIN